MVLKLELFDEEGRRVRESLYQSDHQAHALVCDHAVSGGFTRAVFQAPNTYTLNEIDRSQPKKRPALLVKTRREQQPKLPVPPQQPTAKKVIQPERYPGEVDAKWLADHLHNLLHWLNWTEKRDADRVYRNPRTGQTAFQNASVAELLALLSGHAVSEIEGPDMPEAFRSFTHRTVRPPGEGWRKNSFATLPARVSA